MSWILDWIAAGGRDIDFLRAQGQAQASKMSGPPPTIDPLKAAVAVATLGGLALFVLARPRT